MTHNRIKNSNFINELKKSMAKNINIQVTDNLTDNFRGYAALLRKIKQRVLIAQQRVIYAANEEMLRMYWDVGEMLQQSQDADGWGKKTLQRLFRDKGIYCTQYAIYGAEHYQSLDDTLSARSHQT